MSTPLDPLAKPQYPVTTPSGYVLIADQGKPDAVLRLRTGELIYLTAADVRALAVGLLWLVGDTE